MPFGLNGRQVAIAFDLNTKHVTFIDPATKSGPVILTDKLNIMSRQFLLLVHEMHKLLQLHTVFTPKSMGPTVERVDVIAAPTSYDSPILLLNTLSVMTTTPSGITCA